MTDLNNPDEKTGSALTAGRKRGNRHHSLHWFHWLVVGLSALVAIGAAHLSNRHINQEATQDFARQSELVVNLVSERMAKYEDALWAGVAAIKSAGGEVSHEQWSTFEEHIQIGKKYPGVSGIGLILPVAPEDRNAFIARQRISRPNYNVFPQHDRPELFPIVYIEPVAANIQAIGLDVAHETQRYEGVIRARQTGQAQITGPIVLVQDSDRTPGFLFYAPYYRDPQFSQSPPGNRELLGLVYAPFVVKNLLRGTLGQNQRRVSFKIRDGETVLYDEGFSERDLSEDARFSSQITLDLYGRTWRFDIFATPELIASHSSAEPLMILLGGLGIDAMLLALFILLARSNRRAQTLAARMSAQARLRAEALRQSNEELEKFAYVASHDLKAPLRAIKQLATIVYEDNVDNLPEESRSDLKLLVGRADRMDCLLTGLLDYSRIGDSAREPVVIDVVKLIEDIAENHTQTFSLTINYVRPIATIFTPATVAEIVFSNLIANTVKHHDGRRATVTVSYRYHDGFDEITYADDGPGIDYQYHDKIFEMFQTLKPRDEVEGSGMGLALVRKTLLAHGGKIELIKKEGRGTAFRICFVRPIHGASPSA